MTHSLRRAEAAIRQIELGSKEIACAGLPALFR